MSNQYGETLFRHYCGIWGECSYQASWKKGPVQALPPDFRLLVFSPTEQRSTWIYATVGMSRKGDDDPVEIHLHSPVETQDHLELLTAVGHYHHTGHRLGLGHTINFGRPWLPMAAASYGVITLPYLDGPTLERCLDEDATLLTQCYWLIPITKSEREYIKKRGLEAMEKLFETQDIQYADPARKGLV